ncbi:NAD(P)-dependent dehydrogenase, short-chain alcohol dehydrogenase family [Chryseobacterium oranimense]|uniref:NAD(P)-dependent dehydrogenase, short-chain alcohol dehydrogenase family n=1 Tax=Chryseobacterium oranimense TaxID=421058 RepID=A0A1M5TC56_9FLAO|nr:short chain dehydrogenase [Chryseobacterium oranimense]SHH48299.1 NAD(P)-dependent dehydrogenase, short-chain alcohol dehydrogenase family [Chryseobacterium oranimense]
MKILIVGGNGTIGKKVKESLQDHHEIITAGRNSGDIHVDISDKNSIRKMFEQLKTVDACICTAGTGFYGDYYSMTEEDMLPGIKGKLIGQMNLVLIGKDFLSREGSFTLTSGIAAEHPAKNGTAVAMINGAINSFVLASAQELKNDLRINAVSPGLVEDSFERYKGLFPGYNLAPMNKVVNAYILSTEGGVNGKILKVYS